ncbi:MAG: hypothetical protein ABUL47_01100, partial [Leifsonia sp.]
SFCTPAAALMVAFGLAALARIAAPVISRAASRRVGRVPAAAVLGIAVLLVGALALPDYLHDRGPYAKDGGSDWRQTADYLASQARPGDVVVFDETTKPSRRPELAYRLYPAQFSALTVPEVLTPYFRRDHIWDRMARLAEIRPELDSAASVWAVELPTGGRIPSDVEDLTAHGYRVVGTRLVHRLEVYQLQKEGA